MGYGVLRITEEDTLTIKKSESNDKIQTYPEIKVVAGVGTGIGICYIIKDKEYFSVNPSEGGTT